MRKFICKYLWDKIIVILLLFISCGTVKVVEVPVETIKTEYVDRIHYDSVFINTSTETNIVHDTVYKTKITYEYKYKYKKDTICIIDTIPKVITIDKIKEVNKLSKFLSTFFWIGIIVSIIGIFTLLYKFKLFRL